jgi:hypothetical protein
MSIAQTIPRTNIKSFIAIAQTYLEPFLISSFWFRFATHPGNADGCENKAVAQEEFVR